MNIDKEYLKRLNLIIEKTKAYDNCVFPIGTRGEFGALYISDLKGLLSELETYKKIAERLAEEMMKLPEGNYYYDSKEGWLDWARKEVENDD